MKEALAHDEIIALEIFSCYISYPSLPLIGHMYRLGTTPIESLHAQKKRFGDIFRLDSGPWPTVWLCDYDQITDAMKKEVFSARPHHIIPGIQHTW